MTTTIQVKRTIIVRTQATGFHHWPDAPEKVKYLREPHRHLFKVEAHFNVSHPDRQLEFHMVQRDLVWAVQNLYCTSDQKPLTFSCEAMAELLFNQLRLAYPQVFKVIVSEDGENDGIYEVIPVHP